MKVLRCPARKPEPRFPARLPGDLLRRRRKTQGDRAGLRDVPIKVGPRRLHRLLTLAEVEQQVADAHTNLSVGEQARQLGQDHPLVLQRFRQRTEDEPREADAARIQHGANFRTHGLLGSSQIVIRGRRLRALRAFAVEAHLAPPLFWVFVVSMTFPPGLGLNCKGDEAWARLRLNSRQRRGSVSHSTAT